MKLCLHPFESSSNDSWIFGLYLPYKPCRKHLINCQWCGWFLVSCNSIAMWMEDAFLYCFMPCVDLLYTLSWGWINRWKDPSSKATIYFMFGFSPRHHCTFWEKIRCNCELGTISWKGCGTDEWYSPNLVHPWADEDLNRFEKFKLEGCLEYYSKVSIVFLFSH